MSESKRQRHAGMFKPGQSGNPSGRPKSDATIRDLARKHTDAALSALLEITTNPKAPPSARAHAAIALLDRGWGKPTQHLEAITVGGTFQDWLDSIADEVLPKVTHDIHAEAVEVKEVAALSIDDWL